MTEGKPSPMTAKDLAQRAEAARRAGDLEVAIAQLVAAARLDPDLPELEQVAIEVGAPAIVPLVEAGLRPALIKWLSAQQLRQPTDLDLAHTLGLLWYWWAHELEAAGQVDQALNAWEGVIANWGMLLDHEDFLPAWIRSRLQVYRTEFKADYIVSLRQDIAARLVQDWNHYAGQHATTGRKEWSREYLDLALRFQVEREGARLLQQMGGLAA